MPVWFKPTGVPVTIEGLVEEITLRDDRFNEGQKQLVLSVRPAIWPDGVELAVDGIVNIPCRSKMLLDAMRDLLPKPGERVQVIYSGKKLKRDVDPATPAAADPRSSYHVWALKMPDRPPSTPYDALGWAPKEVFEGDEYIAPNIVVDEPPHSPDDDLESAPF